MRPLASLDQMANYAMERGASDFHLTSGLPPVMTILGNLVASEFARLSPEAVERLVPLDCVQQKTYDEQGQVTLGYRLPPRISGRLHVMRQRYAMHMSARIHGRAPQQALPTLAGLGTGLWILAGAGRSTMQNSLVGQLHAQGRQVIVDMPWLEWPWDYPALSKFTQRADSLVVMDDLNHPGRLRQASELLAGGRDVLATHPGNGYSEVLESLKHYSSGPRYQTLILKLGGIITQRLVPHRSGRSLIGVRQILVGTTTTRSLIFADQGHRLYLIVSHPGETGMQTFERALLEEWKAGNIERQSALDYCDDLESLKRLMEKGR